MSCAAQAGIIIVIQQLIVLLIFLKFCRKATVKPKRGTEYINADLDADETDTGHKEKVRG